MDSHLSIQMNRDNILLKNFKVPKTIDDFNISSADISTLKIFRYPR